LNSKLHALCNASGQPIALHLTEGQASDYKGATALLDCMPQASELLADRGYDAIWFRNALQDRGIILILYQACYNNSNLL
jgi:transposase